MMMLLLSSVSASALVSGGGEPGGGLEGTFPVQFTDGGAETGSMASWTVSGAAPSVVTSAQGIPGPYVGTYFFSGGTGSTGEMSEQLAVPESLLPAVDAGTGQLILEYRYGTIGDDFGESFVEFYDINGVAIGTREVSDTDVPLDTMDWTKRVVTFSIPAGARSVVAGFVHTLVAGSLINAYFDDVKATWVDTATAPKTGIRLSNHSWRNGGDSDGSEDFLKTFKEAGTYAVVFCGTSNLGTDGIARPTITTTTPGVTIENLLGFVEGGTNDWIALYEVTVSSPNTAATFVGVIDDGDFFRWATASWLIENGDLSNAIVFTTKNNTLVSNTVTPAEGSALLMAKWVRNAASPEGLMGAPPGTFDSVLSIVSNMYTATGFNFPATEITIADTQNNTRQVTIGAFIPPVGP